MVGALWLMHINELVVEGGSISGTANYIETYHVPHLLLLNLFTQSTSLFVRFIMSDGQAVCVH